MPPLWHGSALLGGLIAPPQLPLPQGEWELLGMGAQVRIREVDLLGPVDLLGATQGHPE